MRKILLSIICIIGILHAQQTQFFRTYSLGLFDVSEKVIPLADTSYIMVGTTNTTGMNGTDLMLIKTNSIGDQIWRKNIGGNGIQSGKSIVMASDSTGFFLAGYRNNFDSTGYDMWLVKTNFNGDTVWTKTYGGYDWEIAHSINSLSDSTYIIAGETFSYGNGQRDMYILRVDGNGDTLWSRTFGGSDDDVAKYVHVDRHQNILIVGDTKSFGAGNSDVYLIYMDLNGDTIWTKTIGTANDDYGYSADMYWTSANAMHFGIGYTSFYAPDNGQNAYIQIIDSISGSTVSIKPQLEADPSLLDHIMVHFDKPTVFSYCAELKDSFNHISIVFTNQTYPGLDFNTSYMFYAAGGNESTKPLWIDKALDNGYIVTGFSENWGPGPTSAFLLKVDSLLMGPNTPQISIEDLKETLVEVFPNPVAGEKFYINSESKIESVKILALNGELLQSLSIPASQKSITLQNPMIESGIYLLEIKTEKGTVFRKIIF